MHTILISCAKTGQPVSTGIGTDPDTFARIPNVTALAHCPHCGADHLWSKSSAWICETAPSRDRRVLS